MKVYQDIKQKYQKYAKFIDAFISVFLIPQVLYFIVAASTKDQYDGEFARIPLYICIGVVILCMYSIFRTTILFDEALRKQFCETVKRVELKKCLFCLLRQKSFWVRALLIAVVYLAFPLSWTCNMMVVALGVTSFPKKFALQTLLHSLQESSYVGLKSALIGTPVSEMRTS